MILFNTLSLARTNAILKKSVLLQSTYSRLYAKSQKSKSSKAGSLTVDPPQPWGPIPTQGQINYHREELSAFIHYGMNTFTGVEWGNGHEDENLFVPDGLNTDQWVATLKKAGFKRIIMIGRHHDGFCLWKSNYTQHQVNASKQFQETSKKLGQSGDVIEELSKSCSKYDMNMGVYLSPWDANSSYYGNEQLYNEYYMNQLSEVLGSADKRYGNKGKFVEVWMDGAKGTGAADQKYWFLKWFELIERLQPGAVVFSPYGSTVRWIGNEAGHAGETCWSKLNQTRQRAWYDKTGGDEPAYLNAGDPTGDIWSIGECDVSLTSGWFWKAGKVPKTMQELSDLYFKSVGRGQPFLLNVPPNTTGLMDQAFLNRVAELGDTIDKTFSLNFASTPTASATASSYRGNDDKYSPKNAIDDKFETYWTMDDDKKTGWIEIDLGQTRKFDIVSISEHIELGQRVEKFLVEYQAENSQTWNKFEEGTTIGAKRLCRQIAVTARKVRITIVSSQAVPIIDKIGVYKAYGEFELGSGIPDGLVEVLSDKFILADRWNHESEGIWTTKVAAFAQYEFTGSKFFVYGIVDPSHGHVDVFVDDQKVDTFDSHASERKLRQLLFSSPDFAYGKHTVRLVLVDKAMALHSLELLTNEGRGMFEIEKLDYDVPKGGKFQLKIKRVGGVDGECKVTLQTTHGSAVHDRHYEDITLDLEYKQNENEKTVFIHTINNTETTGNLTFFCQIVDPTNKAIIGYNQLSTVTIYNGKVPPEALIKVTADKFTTSGEWHDFDESNGAENGIWSEVNGSYAEYTFSGTKCYVFGTTGKKDSFVEVYVDGVKARSFFVFAGEIHKNVLIFESNDLTNHDLHTVKVLLYDGFIGVNYLQILDNDEAGIYEFNMTRRIVHNGDKTSTTVKRLGGDKRKSYVTVKSKDGTAKSDVDYKPINTKLFFDVNENAKEVIIETIENKDHDKNITFNLEISDATNDALIVFNNVTEIEINAKPNPTELPTPTPSPAKENTTKFVIIFVAVLVVILVCVAVIFVAMRNH
ncbi:Calx-beta domain containing protein [Trichomonas vaginalis G3]|uniref:alpha-L-fucosidase n=1 Tax=Trichomonas vaginalis (strain ATCC PRA-98 / G3) TaxID=412133 RepID=A2ETX7_TRIV3|nr:alpha-l-fucosidase family [Trichomonas vaginalis G3]EAY03865.1 Calx-beta domain containing protein [Trichomonas vaginalis G3]KAI5552966.1 alpha-l-fucosidase family [Trichomonas vaginalis G3]|eukprot:XP_001316088.1 Calx-beta domain containing protein [Trichomonas vaginalis G3]